jgi:hypothetical protein
VQAELERFLARLLTDSELRERFFADPAGVAKQEGLSQAEASAMAAVPAQDLRIAARSYEHKRKSAPPRRSRLRSLVNWFRLGRR